MNISFHIDNLSLRGVEVSTYDYAHFNEKLLNNNSIIFSSKHGNLEAYEKFSNRFEVILYDAFEDMQKIIDNKHIDIAYFQKAGNRDGKLFKNCKNVVHSVFQLHEPHGDVYAYISKWLSDHVTNGAYPYVPYMVDILKYDNNMDYREYLNIPSDAMVFGYYGGRDSFNIEFAKQAIYDVAIKNKNIYFLFMNVDNFGLPIENIKFLKGTYDIDKKISFINTCDACIHARNGGESFGLTVAEFSIKNKPIITTYYVNNVYFNDLAHIDMLGNKAIIYNDYNSLTNILTNISRFDIINKDWNAYGKFSPENVMNKFKSIFIN